MRAAENERKKHEQIRLRCLAGGVAPEDVTGDAARLSKLTPAAVENIWPILEPCVTQPMTPALGQHLSSYCVRYEVAEADLGHVIRICRWLLRQAASVDLPEAEFAEDIATIWPDAGAMSDVLLEHYGRIKNRLRDALLADALVKHGNVLENIEWRVDRVAADAHAPRLDLPVALVTLAYRNRDRSEHLTLQLTPEQLMRATKVLAALAEQTMKLMPAPPKTDS